jgi:serine/threonine-protein kinase
LAEFGPDAPAARSRFRNEAKAASRLHHPHIVMLYEYGEESVGPYIVMEYVEGKSLDETLRSAPITRELTVRLMAQLLDALQHAHDQGIVHRDIKPANLVLTPQGHLKVADFGVARIEASGMTIASTAVGTPGHMSPEQYMGDQVDRRTDIFASGVLLYQLLTQRSPFGGSDANIMYETLHSDPTPPSTLGSAEVPAAYDDVVARAIAKRPEARYANARDFKRALLDAHLVEGAIKRPARAEMPRPGIALPRAAPPDAAAEAARGFEQRSEFGNDAEPSSFAPLLEANALIAKWITDEELRQTAKMLAEYVGPLAKTLTRRAATRAASRHAFNTLVAEQVDDPHDRATLLRRLTG